MPRLTFSRARLPANPSIGSAAGLDEAGQFRAGLRWQVGVGMRVDDRLLFGVVLVELIEQLTAGIP